MSIANETSEVTFTPQFGRFLRSESKRQFAFGTVLFASYMLYLEEPTIVIAVIVGGIVVIATLLHAFIFRSLRNIVIGPTWIKGPCVKPIYGTTVTLGEVDWTRSGVKGRDFWIRPVGDEAIRFKTSWFTDEQVNEIRRLLRDRCPGAEAVLHAR